MKVSVIDQAGKLVRSHVMCGIEQGVLHTSTKYTTSSVFFGSAGEPKLDKMSGQKPRQQVMDTYEVTEADGTLVMVMVMVMVMVIGHWLLVILDSEKRPRLIRKWWNHVSLQQPSSHSALDLFYSKEKRRYKPAFCVVEAIDT